VQDSPPLALDIHEDDLAGPEVAALLAEHMASMRAITPPASIHALDLDGLRAPGVTFWSAWQGAELVGCGALKQLDPRHGEIKSMRTSERHRRQGIAAAVLEHLLRVARARGYRRLSLETGVQPGFAPARALYERYGFEECAPFADYVEDPNSVFMTLTLTG
jgi:putative acetyltransferase